MEDCRLKIVLEDRPGMLSKVVELAAKNKANLFSISHLREQKKEDKLPVVLQFQARERDYSKLISDISADGIEIVERSIGGSGESRPTQEFVLIGHVIDSDMKDTIYSISSDEVMVRSLDISLKSLKEPSSVFVEIAAKDKKSLLTAANRLNDIAKDKELLLIEGIEE